MGTDSPHLLSQLTHAQEAIEREQTILPTEIEVYREFGDRIRQLEPDRESTNSDQRIETLSTKVGATRDSKAGANQSARTTIRTAYEETVMATPSYDEEYGDTAVEALSSDFGRPLTNALLSDRPFTPLVKSRLLNKIDAAVEQRQDFYRNLDRESSALQTAHRELASIDEEIFAIESRPVFECPLSELEQLVADTTELEDQCDELLARRQSGDLHSADTLFRSPHGISLADYLYQPLDCHYPLLQSVADVSSRLSMIQTHLKTARQTQNEAVP